MKNDHAKSPMVVEVPIDPEVDAENAEFDFSNAPRPGRNTLYQRAQGRFNDVPDDELGSSLDQGLGGAPHPDQRH